MKFHVLSSLPPGLQTQGCVFTQVARYPEKKIETAIHLAYRTRVLLSSLLPHWCNTITTAQRGYLYEEPHLRHIKIYSNGVAQGWGTGLQLPKAATRNISNKNQGVKKFSASERCVQVTRAGHKSETKQLHPYWREKGLASSFSLYFKVLCSTCWGIPHCTKLRQKQ